MRSAGNRSGRISRQRYFLAGTSTAALTAGYQPFRVRQQRKKILGNAICSRFLAGTCDDRAGVHRKYVGCVGIARSRTGHTNALVTGSKRRIVSSQSSEAIFPTMCRLLGIKVESETDLLRIVGQGLSPRVYKRVMKKLDLPLDLIGPATAMRRRIRGNERLNQTESERLLRVARVYSEAVRLFRDDASAMAWMNTPAELISGQPSVKPMRLAAYDSGARLLESNIRRTAHGLF